MCERCGWTSEAPGVVLPDAQAPQGDIVSQLRELPFRPGLPRCLACYKAYRVMVMLGDDLYLCRLCHKSALASLESERSKEKASARPRRPEENDAQAPKASVVLHGGKQ